MSKFIKANSDLCIGCRTCLAACVAAHQGTGVFYRQPDSYEFHPRLELVSTERLCMPSQCRQCPKPLCKQACERECIELKDDIVLIHRENCGGCGNCVEACPFKAVRLVPVFDQWKADGSPVMAAEKCDLCFGLPDGPACVSHCPCRALSVEERKVILKK